MKTWIDITDFLNWQGNFTGIQRIQYNIAKQYIEHQENVAFFVYKEPERRFEVIDFEPDAVAADGMIQVVSVETRGRVATLARSKTPVSIKRLARIARSTLLTNKQATVTSTKAPFAVGDMVLVLGGLWFGTFAADLATAKAANSFKLIHMIHDMIPVVYPSFVVESLPAAFESYKEIIFTIADGLITNSDSSRRDALAFMKTKNITPPPIQVFRIGEDPVSDSGDRPLAEVTGKPFLLSVGTMEGRKNHTLLYYVYKEAKRKGVDLPPLVVAGRKGWLVDDICYIIQHDPETKHKILLKHDVSDSQLSWLYRNCLFTLYPSFYEGWGMPIAESLAYGKLCIPSGASSMTEIAGDLIEYISPSDPAGCLALICKYLDPKVLKAKEKNIAAHYQSAKWVDSYNAISNFAQTIQ